MVFHLHSHKLLKIYNPQTFPPPTNSTVADSINGLAIYTVHENQCETNNDETPVFDLI